MARLVDTGALDHAEQGKVLQKAALRQFYGLDASKRTTLMMSGGYGTQAISEQLIERLTAIPEHQCAVICGRNARWEALLKEKYDGRPDIHIYGYVERVHELMA
ncbi:hypothetical protein [Paenibacillus sp. OSY-SE]|uniref:hypothetical protein n=1 Tax=Paenibacillus sp. OSY-SE TaxID=1196323 RepID=UPI0002DEBC02|nr:hypothetical protein [Paenibacillus sp. OSY-SE]